MPGLFRPRPPAFLFLLPLLHLAACVYVERANLEWMTMVWVDLPLSIIALGLAWGTDNPVLWFSLIGGAGWYFLGWGAWRLIHDWRLRRSHTAGA